MRVQPVETDRLRGRVESSASPVTHPQHLATWRRKHELARTLAGDLHGQGIDQEARNRHASCLVRLRRGKDNATPDLGRTLGDVRAPAQQVQSADS